MRNRMIILKVRWLVVLTSHLVLTPMAFSMEPVKSPKPPERINPATRLLSGLIEVDRFDVPLGEIVIAVGDLEIVSKGDVEIQGCVVGKSTMGKDRIVDGASITIRSETQIIIGGHLLPGDGGDGAPGVRAGVGGSITLKAPHIVVSKERLLSGGSGGRGGRDVDSIHGGPGGKGGDVKIYGALVGAGIRGGRGGEGGFGVTGSTDSPGGNGGAGGPGGIAIHSAYEPANPKIAKDSTQADARGEVAVTPRSHGSGSN